MEVKPGFHDLFLNFCILSSSSTLPASPLWTRVPRRITFGPTFIFCRVPRRAATHSDVTCTSTIHHICHRTGLKPNSAEVLSHTQYKDNAVNHAGGGGFNRLNSTTERTDRRAVDRQLCTSAGQLAHSLTIPLQLKPTQQKNRLNQSCVLFSWQLKRLDDPKRDLKTLSAPA